TEVIRAWELGANVIKIYPARLLGGPTYIRTISQPIRGIPMLAGGPVDLEEIDEYLDAGAVAVNLGTSLAVPCLVAERRWEEIEKRVALALDLLTRRPREVAESAVVH
ncbi:MAG TPA: hypothetical protein VM534_09110, partial [Thermoanaerobaculia bacterium]|nr:hypothetical protein [Thermoanaerobaculia bacterium]